MVSPCKTGLPGRLTQSKTRSGPADPMISFSLSRLYDPPGFRAGVAEPLKGSALQDCPSTQKIRILPGHFKLRICALSERTGRVAPSNSF